MQLNISMNKDLTIFIPTFNRTDMLRSCILSIKNSLKTLNINYEIIIVNESDADIINLPDKEIRVLEFNREVLPCYAMYYALKESQGRYFLRVDDDNEINVNLIPLLYNYITKNNNVAYCGALGIRENGDVSNPGTILSKYLKLSIRPVNIESEIYEVDLVDNVYIMNKELIDIKKFYKSCKFFPWSFEDGTDQIRLKKLGYKIVVLSRALSVHHTHKSHINSKQIYYYARSKIILYKSIFEFKFIKSILLSFIALLYLPYIYKLDIKVVRDLIVIYINYLKGIINGLKFLRKNPII